MACRHARGAVPLVVIGRLSLALLMLGAASAGNQAAAAVAYPATGSHADGLSPQQVRNAYALHCSGCHGMTGYGLPANGIPDLHGASRWIGDARGRAYLIQVPGVAASGLSDAQTAAVLNWVIEQYSAPVPGAAAFTAAEVHAQRSALLTDPDRERAQLFGAR